MSCPAASPHMCIQRLSGNTTFDATMPWAIMVKGDNSFVSPFDAVMQCARDNYKHLELFTDFSPFDSSVHGILASNGEHY